MYCGLLLYYHKVRDYLKEVIPKWSDEFLEPADAKAPEHRYPGPPEVSPIESDNYFSRQSDVCD
jgi:hypothetical protein